MRQLSPLEAQFLSVESATTMAQIGAVSILDPSTAPGGVIGVTDVQALIERRAHLVPLLRSRLVEVPFGLDYPYWIEDPGFDLEYHVREIALPPPGDERQLDRQVGWLAERPLDRRRPLWEVYLIHGLEGGRMALYTKVHHAIIDGVAGVEIVGVLVDTTPEPQQSSPHESDLQSEDVPGQLEMLERGLLGLANHPLRVARALSRALPHLTEFPGSAKVPGAGLVAGATRGVARLAGQDAPAGQAERPRLNPPPTPFNAPITPHRRFAFGSLPLDSVKEVKNAFGLTVNDVVMALCATALRRWLTEHSALPDEPLVVAVPFSIRAEQAEGSGNEISVMLAPLPTHLEDPLQRLRATAEGMAAVKERFDATPASLLQEFSTMLPAALTGLAARAEVLRFAAHSPPFNLFVSNIPGPQLPLYVAGARILAQYPVSAISDVTGAINITVISYDGHLDFGIIACREAVPDVWDLIGYLHEGLDELTQWSQQPAP